MGTGHLFTRRELYERVWAEPISALAKTAGVRRLARQDLSFKQYSAAIRVAIGPGQMRVKSSGKCPYRFARPVKVISRP